MPDAEALKLIVNGGSFGLLALGTVWVLFRGVPLLQQMQEKAAEHHRATIQYITDKHEEERTAAETRCRDERRETVAMFQKESELNRQSRAEQAQRCGK